MVPGITSAIAAPAAAGIPVTMRNHASAFTVVTGHVDPAGATPVDWEAHAATGATLVILMGVGGIGAIAKRLIAVGRSPATPVAVVHAATTSEQRVVRLTLADVGHADLAAPSTIVVGDVAALDLLAILNLAASLGHPWAATVRERPPGPPLLAPAQVIDVEDPALALPRLTAGLGHGAGHVGDRAGDEELVGAAEVGTPEDVERLVGQGAGTPRCRRASPRRRRAPRHRARRGCAPS